MHGLASSLLLLVLGAACAPKVATAPPSFDEELPSDRRSTTTLEEAPPSMPERPLAPPGKGLRTGTISRARLDEVLDAGAGVFLRQLELTPKLADERFVGWQLVQLVDRMGPLADIDLQPGDVLLAINGKPLSRPDQLQVVWDSLRSANELKAQLWRGGSQFTLAFAIE
jgi:hypothetical protein